MERPRSKVVSPGKNPPGAPPADAVAHATTKGRPAKPAPASESHRTENHTGGGRPPERHGYVSVFARPWAYVYLDGKKLEETTPLSRLEVPAGRHALTFKTEDGRSRGPIVLTVEPGEHKVLDPVIFQ